jgi:putative glutamine amidotransferase
MGGVPLILISSATIARAAEMADPGICVTEHYACAVIAAGGIPVVAARFTERQAVAECLERCDGLMLTGGNDVNPALYTKSLAPELEATLGPVDEPRDQQEVLMVEEAFRQKKPLLAICRGHQMLNVALGGDLIADIPSQVPGAIEHRRGDQRFDPVHDVQLTNDSLLARISGTTSLGVNSSHHQAVGRLAGMLRVTGRTSDGVVEAVELAPEASDALPWMLSIQSHPERLYERYPVHLEVFRSFVEACQTRPQRR